MEQKVVITKEPQANALNMPPKDWKYFSLYDLCMAYLKGEFIPGKEFEYEGK